MFVTGIIKASNKHKIDYWTELVCLRETGWPCVCGMVYKDHTKTHRLSICDAYEPMENLNYVAWCVGRKK